jgi:CheY-like chemotaxis protein/HPt (histidine-containing phosphotransfer) domain-containing protein
MMGGDIFFKSEPGKGSTFTVAMPLKKAEVEIPSDSKVQQTSQYKQPMKDLSSYRVLVTDDHPVNMLFATKLLKKMGFTRIDSAVNGLEAVEKMKNSNKAYDLILMDCQMPEMDGFEASQKIRELEQVDNRKRTPIVAMTAHAMEADRDLCFKSGMDDYISKPVNPDKLREILARWLLKQEDKTTDILQSVSSQNSSATETIVNLEHLELFTEGDLDQEKIISDAFLSAGQSSLEVMRFHLDGQKTEEDWNRAAHKLKGSSAQIGADSLSVLCLNAEKESSNLPLEEKKTLLAEIEIEFRRVKAFFESRQV